MSYRFRIVAGSIDALNEFLRNKFHGVSILHEPVYSSESRPSPEMAYDSAEDILQFIVSASRDIDISLFSVWLYQITVKSGSKKTTINGQQIPTDQAELAALIVTLIEEQNGRAEHDPASVGWVERSDTHQ